METLRCRSIGVESEEYTETRIEPGWETFSTTPTTVAGLRQFHERRFHAVRYLVFTTVLADDYRVASVFRRSVDLVVV
ncbi:hypothetical protein BG842_25095 [Haladaptatus sp. W1]|nr:hypothetical protein BG842_25095 [Haladaptatus sp. W1]